MDQQRQRMTAIGRKRLLISPDFRCFERPLSVKADIQEYPQNFHNIDQHGTSALHPKADIRLVLANRFANDPKRS